MSLPKASTGEPSGPGDVRFEQARYVTSSALPEQLPAPAGWEVAFAGRSNAGKSSAINTIVGRNRLAFTSRTPGRTQLISFFALGPSAFLVDLPGYGYAKVPEEVRQRWEGLLAGYVQGRASLAGLVVVMDARHPLTALDRQLLDWVAPGGRPVHVLLTKSDKLTRNESTRTLREVRAILQAEHPFATAQLFSSLNRSGVDEARALLLQWLSGGGQQKAPG